MHNILDYGAANDGKTVCTAEIQRAIDLCEKDGTVYIPKGTFMSGALWLKSDMTLYLEDGARLVGSDNTADFPIMGYPFEGYEQLCYASLLNTDGPPYKNITIAGKGTIDANGSKLLKAELSERRGKRGRAICIRNTENVKITGVTIRQSPSWGLHLVFCKNVELDDIKVHTKYDENGIPYDGIHNGDGIDIDSCKQVRITNSLISSQDDCIAIKSGRDVAGRRVGIPSENVTIENCTFKSGFGVAMGSEMSGGIKDVYVRKCAFTDTFSIASVKAVRGRGAYVKNIHFEDCSLSNNDMTIDVTKWFKGAIYMDGFYGEDEFDADTPIRIDEKTPFVDGIYLKNIKADTVKGYAVYLCGLPEAPYENVYLENVTAHGEYGFFEKNIDNLQLINTDISGDKN